MDKKRILVAPLDWGLGHASRCIPLITILLSKGVQVILAADNGALQILRKEFPRLEFIQFPGYGLRFPKGKAMILGLILQIPKILTAIRRENRTLQDLIAEKKIDIVISDNRYGLWSAKIPCVILTHQLFIPAPFANKLINYLNRKQLEKFNECWVPDFEGPVNFSGALSHQNPRPANVRFIGPLSRFESDTLTDEKEQTENNCKKKYELFFILSGPEPQRSIFEQKIRQQLGKMNPVPGSLIVQGLPETEILRETEALPEMKGPTIAHHLSTTEMKKAISESELIICRPGYSTIMDLSRFSKKVVFVPTPGQTEQQYLAKKFKEEQIAWSVSQKEFDIGTAIKESSAYKGFETAVLSAAEGNAVSKSGLTAEQALSSLL